MSSLVGPAARGGSCEVRLVSPRYELTASQNSFRGSRGAAGSTLAGACRGRSLIEIRNSFAASLGSRTSRTIDGGSPVDVDGPRERVVPIDGEGLIFRPPVLSETNHNRSRERLL